MVVNIPYEQTLEGRLEIQKAKENGTYVGKPMGIVESLYFGANEGHKMNYQISPVLPNTAVEKLEEVSGLDGTKFTMPLVEIVNVEDKIKGLEAGTTVDGENSVLRYPASPAIRSDSDYILMTFFKYLPPGQQTTRTGDVQYTTEKDLGVASTDPKNVDYKRNLIEKTQHTAPYLNVYNNTATGDGSSQYERTKAKQIMLYMPEDISTGYKANWNGKAISTAAMDMLSAGTASGFGNKLMGVGATLTGMAQRVGATWSANTVRSTIQSITGDTLTNDEVFGAIGGIVTNPNTELLFNNMDMRTFQLKWKLVPRNQTEAAHVRGIINTLKKAMLPGTQVDDVFEISWGDGVTAGYISVPDLVRVSFMSGSSPADYLPQYKMCAITQVDVNYTPDGSYATTYGADRTTGGVVATELTVSFQETKLIYREEVHRY